MFCFPILLWLFGFKHCQFFLFAIAFLFCFHLSPAGFILHVLLLLLSSSLLTSMVAQQLYEISCVLNFFWVALLEENKAIKGTNCHPWYFSSNFSLLLYLLTSQGYFIEAHFHIVLLSNKKEEWYSFQRGEKNEKKRKKKGAMNI